MSWETSNATLAVHQQIQLRIAVLADSAIECTHCTLLQALAICMQELGGNCILWFNIRLELHRKRL